MAKLRLPSEPTARQQAEERLTSLYVKAADVLGGLLDAEDPAVRLKAALVILKTAQVIE